MCLTTGSPGISWERVSEIFERDDIAEVGFVRLLGLFQLEAVSVAAVEPAGPASSPACAQLLHRERGHVGNRAAWVGHLYRHRRRGGGGHGDIDLQLRGAHNRDLAASV